MPPTIYQHMSVAQLTAAHGFALDVRRMNPQPDSALHHEHDFHELVIITAGQGLHHIQAQDYPIGLGDIFLVKPGLIHSYRHTQGLQLINLLYVPTLLNLPRLDLDDIAGYHAFFELEPAMRQRDGFRNRLRLTEAQLQHVQDLVEQIEAELTSAAPGHRGMATAVFLQLIITVARYYSRAPNPKTAQLVQLSRLVSYLGQQYSQPIRLETMCEVAGMSRSSLHRAFQQALGQTPVQHLVQVRIGKAAELLRDSSLSVGAVATCCGFGDSNYFSKAFKAATGETPRTYRRHL